MRFLSVGWMLSLVLASAGAQVVQVDASQPVRAPETGFLHMGGKSSNGHTLDVNSRSLVLDGKPWLPVMGEMHYARIPEDKWEQEILKMQAAGISIISTYIFWIHHEEVEGTFDWSGRRDLRRFVELCAKHGMWVYLRVGPWAHGEARNGGFPDWLVKRPEPRTNDPAYLASVTKFYGQIGEQVRGLMFKDGGPVIGTQLENEYGKHGAGKGAEHILKLKEIALASGLDTPLYSVTGWPSQDFPPREVLPVSGGYPDGFWFGAEGNLAPSDSYAFNFKRQTGDMGAMSPNEAATGKADLRHDPNFSAEQAGGMELSYHRRPLMTADDITAETLTGLGSGLNLYGYYMFHGGANPEGKLSTLQESKATNYPNDMPQISYDFQAPLGEFGQVRETYRKTRELHLFVNAFGTELAGMAPFAPAIRPKNSADTSVPRVSVRTDGDAGFVFVNNYVRQLELPSRKGFQVELTLASGKLLIPEKPVDVPAGDYFVWPVNLPVGKAKLVYATAQALTRVETPRGLVMVFFAVPGIAPEFSFAAGSVKAVVAAGAQVGRPAGGAEGRWTVTGLIPGMRSTIEVTDSAGVRTTLLILTSDEAQRVAMVKVGGKSYVALTASDLFVDGDRIHLRSTGSNVQQLALMPGAALQGSSPGASKQNGLWSTQEFSQPAVKLALEVKQVRQADVRAAAQVATPVAEPGQKPKNPGARVPEDAAFDKAAVWELRPDRAAIDSAQGLSNVFLQMNYTGDLGHLLAGGKLVDDNFFGGRPWQVGLKWLSSVPGMMELRVLPMAPDARMYLDPKARAMLTGDKGGARLMKAELIPEYEAVVTLAR